MTLKIAGIINWRHSNWRHTKEVPLSFRRLLTADHNHMGNHAANWSYCRWNIWLLLASFKECRPIHALLSWTGLVPPSHPSARRGDEAASELLPKKMNPRKVSGSGLVSSDSLTLTCTMKRVLKRMALNAEGWARGHYFARGHVIIFKKTVCRGTGLDSIQISHCSQCSGLGLTLARTWTVTC